MPRVFYFTIFIFISTCFAIAQTEIPKVLRIAIIDGFTNKCLDFDNDGIYDISHGNMISSFIETGLPHAEIVKFDLENPDDPIFLWRSVPGYQLETVLTRIITDINNGIKYDAINVSISNSELYVFAKKGKKNRTFFKNQKQKPTLIDITPENLLLRRNLILSGLDYHTNSCISLIENIIGMGCSVYIAAGNGGNETFNLLNLSVGAINVGALNEDGTKSDISCDNILINRWEQSIFPISKTEDGINFTGDGTTDIFDSCLSAEGENLIKKLIGGTSVATAIAIVEDFKNK